MQQERIQKYNKRIDALDSSLKLDMERVRKRAEELRNEKPKIDKMISDTAKELNKYEKTKEKYQKDIDDQTKKLDILMTQIAGLEESKMVETQEKVMELAIKMGEVKTDTANIKNAREMLEKLKKSIRSLPPIDMYE